MTVCWLYSNMSAQRVFHRIHFCFRCEGCESLMCSSLCSLRLNVTQVFLPSLPLPSLRFSHTRVQWYAGLTCGTRAASSNPNSVSAVVSAAAFQARCGEAAFFSLPLHRASTQQYCFVLLCAWGVIKKLCVLGYVRLCLTAQIRSTAQLYPDCSLLRFDWNKFSIHDKVIKRSNLKSRSYSSTVYTLCVLFDKMVE